jgi:hypothetical protein
MVCYDRWPGGVCSEHGFCLEIAANSSVGLEATASCVCLDGYTGNGDLLDFSGSDCSIRTDDIRTLYTVVAVAACLAIGSALINIVRRVVSFPPSEREAFEASK